MIIRYDPKRRRIDLLDKLRTGKGLSKKRKNIIGGNFNVVEHDRYDGKDDRDDVEEERKRGSIPGKLLQGVFFNSTPLKS